MKEFLFLLKHGSKVMVAETVLISIHTQKSIFDLQQLACYLFGF